MLISCPEEGDKDGEWSGKVLEKFKKQDMFSVERTQLRGGMIASCKFLRVVIRKMEQSCFLLPPKGQQNQNVIKSKEF